MDYSNYKPASCAECPLYKQPGPVWGVGSSEEKIGYIGQNPGRQECEEFKPFIGPSGAVLGRQLYETGIRRTELFVTNVVKCLTPNNRPPTAKEISCCAPLLKSELEKHPRLDTYILAGDVAFNAIIGNYSTLHRRYKPPASIMQRMGCVEQKDGKKWIGSIHPAFIMRMPDFRMAPLQHLRKAYSIAGKEIPLPKVYYNDREQFERHRAAALKNKIFADDVETAQTADFDGEDDYIGGDWAVTLSGWSAIDYEAIVCTPGWIKEWEEVYADTDIWQAEANGEYDRYHYEKYCPQLNKRWDTMLAFHYLCNNRKRKYLKPDTLAEFTNLPYYDRDLGDVDFNLYNGMDVITTLLAAKEQMRRMQKVGLYDIFLKVGMRILPILEQWRRNGTRLDVRRAVTYQKIISLRLAKGSELMQKLVGPLFNWNSPDQRKQLLYERWKLPPQYNTVEDKKTKQRKKVLTTDYDARETLKRWIQDPKFPQRKITHSQAMTFFQLDDYISSNEKLLEYFDRIAPDQKLHTYWKAHGAATFRLASKPNQQNWPTWCIYCGQDTYCKDPENHGSLRSMGIADHDDDLLIGIDFSQLQLWIYATQFNIKALLDIFHSGEYLYGVVYEQVVGKPFFKPGMPKTKKNKGEWITEEELLRAKAIPLGFLFGRTGESVAAEKGWAPQIGINYRNKYFADKPELVAAHAKIQFDMKQKGYLRPPPGMLLHYPVPNLQGLNCFAQTPEAIMVQEKIIAIEDKIAASNLPRGTRTMLSVHDSITCNVRHARRHPEIMTQFAEEILFPALDEPVIWLNNFVFPYEAKVSIRWDWETTDYNVWKERAIRGTDKYCAPFIARAQDRQDVAGLQKES